ncbi:membrane protein [Scheffersomyces coipomensis]|uniref:uncharacterized protein n=1 Tax=Scheffersomyces coipomensis TaxID=1788519 RepID=UPI00315D2758
MAGLFDIEGHLVFYRSYHFNPTNVAIHLVCIPIILLSIITILLPHDVIGLDNPYVNFGSLMAFGYGFYYILLDWTLGVPSFLFLSAYAYLVKSFYLTLDDSSILTQTQFINYAIVAHVGSWLAQFYGHGVHEKRAPALIDNLLQALVLAPFFVVYEIAFASGFKTDLQKTMNNKAGVLARDFKLKDAQKSK